MEFKIGQSQDTHKLVENRKLILGGIEIPYHLGLLGHSDADVLLHVIAESIIGALGMGDLGTFFPDNDPQYKGISSVDLLIKIKEIMEQQGYKINNIDTIIITQKPKLQPYIKKMKNKIATILEINENQLNIKATTSEKLGFIGREEGISAQCALLLIKNKL